MLDIFKECEEARRIHLNLQNEITNLLKDVINESQIELLKKLKHLGYDKNKALGAIHDTIPLWELSKKVWTE